MKYLCLIYINEQYLNQLAPGELNACVEESLAYDAELYQSGQLVAAQALQSVVTASTVRVRSGKLSITDGPFAETYEQLGGFLLINAADLNEAIRVASKLPGARLGCVEVRPIMELNPEQQHVPI